MSRPSMAPMPAMYRTCRSSTPLPSAPRQGGTKVVLASADAEMGRKRTAVQQLIAAYRNVGSRWADLDPLKRTERQDSRAGAVVLRVQRCRPGSGVRHQQHLLRQRPHEPARAAQRAARDLLRHRGRGVHVHHRPGQKRWWQQKLESIRSKPSFNAEKKKHILDRLTAAEGLERFLHTKYVGQKRFSLEGGESFIAAMDELIQQAGAKGRAGNRDRHGPPWPPERAGQHAGQDAGRPVRRVRPHRPRRPACG
jgi:2-oxoglutarate dehydrogenase E1 component